MKKIILIIIALLAAALLVCVLPLPSGVSKTMSGVWLRDDGSSQTVSLSVDGTLYRYLLRRDKWVGRIDIPGVFEREGDEKIELDVSGSYNDVCLSPVFLYDRGLNSYHVYGTLFFDKHMNSLVFELSDGLGGVIAAPATNADEAKALIDALPFGGIVPDGLA